MMEKITNEGLVRLVERIQNAEVTEKEIDDIIDLLKESVPYPSVSDLIFYSEDEMTAEQIVEVVLAYAPPRLGS